MQKKDVVIVLGQFDSVHKGHKKIIKNATEYAKKIGVTPLVFTFDKDVATFLNGKPEEESLVFTNQERKSIIEKMGAEVHFEKTTKKFLSKGKLAFLKYLDTLYNVKAYFCGFDYRFGKNAGGNVDYLEKYAKEYGKFLSVEPEICLNGEKISTRVVKRLLKEGNVKGANQLLGSEYFICGDVKKGRAVGRSLGFPTANIYPDVRKVKIKSGVYSGFVNLNETKYNAIINFGGRPTYSLAETLVEVYLDNFSGNLYGKELCVYFDGFIRDIRKFVSEEELKKQLEKDLEVIR